MKTLSFKEAFEGQLAMAKPLTEDSLKMESTPRMCRLTNELFEEGDEVLYVMHDKQVMACKRSALEAKNWSYTDTGTLIPIVV